MTVPQETIFTDFHFIFTHYLDTDQSTPNESLVLDKKAATNN